MVIDFCEVRQWCDISIGDFVFVPENHIVPCDMVVLDCQVSSAYVDSLHVLGRSDPMARYPLSATKSIEYSVNVSIVAR
jgi:magnesium-transporting ATPase (P-type)